MHPHLLSPKNLEYREPPASEQALLPRMRWRVWFVTGGSSDLASASITK